MASEFERLYGIPEPPPAAAGVAAASTVVPMTYDGDDMQDGTVSTVSAGGKARFQGVCSFRAMVMSQPVGYIEWVNKKTGAPGVFVKVNYMLLDHPSNSNHVRINDSELAYLEDSGLTMSVVPVQKGAETASTGVRQNVIKKYQETRQLRRGSIFTCTVVGKKGFKNPSNTVICEPGDIVDLNGVELKLSAGDEPSKYTGKTVFFEEYSAREVVHWKTLAECEQLQNYFYSSLLNWLPENGVPTYLWPRIDPQLDVGTKLAEKEARKNTGELTEAQKKKIEDEKKRAAEYGSSHTIVHMDPNDPDAEYHEAGVKVPTKDMRKLGNDALLYECRKWLYAIAGGEIYVPLHIVMGKIIGLLSQNNARYTLYTSKFRGMMRPDPTDKGSKERTTWSKVKYVEVKQGETAPPDVYEPFYQFCRQAVQIKAYHPNPENPGQMNAHRQYVDLIIKMSAASIRAFGISDPQDQMTVGPYLAAVTPAVCSTYLLGQSSAHESKDQDHFSLHLMVSNKGFMKLRGNGNTRQTEKLGVFADVTSGVVSAGYEVSHAAAVELLDLLGKRTDRATSKTRQVAANMTAQKVMNIYAKGKAEERNHMNEQLNQPVINCCETAYNAVSDGADYKFFIVSTWAEKNFAKLPALKAHLTELCKNPAAAVEQFSAVFVEAAKTGIIADPALLSLYGPSRLTSCGKDAAGNWGISAVEPQPHVAESPFDYVIFAIRRDHLKARDLDNYFSDNAWADVVSIKAELNPLNVLLAEIEAAKKRKALLPPPAPPAQKGAAKGTPLPPVAKGTLPPAPKGALLPPAPKGTLPLPPPAPKAEAKLPPAPVAKAAPVPEPTPSEIRDAYEGTQQEEEQTMQGQDEQEQQQPEQEALQPMQDGAPAADDCDI
jgi:hypothetical protein